LKWKIEFAGEQIVEQSWDAVPWVYLAAALHLIEHLVEARVSREGKYRKRGAVPVLKSTKVYFLYH